MIIGRLQRVYTDGAKRERGFTYLLRVVPSADAIDTSLPNTEWFIGEETSDNQHALREKILALQGVHNLLVVADHAIALHTLSVIASAPINFDVSMWVNTGLANHTLYGWRLKATVEGDRYVLSIE